MAEIDLTNMSLEDLKSLKTKVTRAIDSYEERRKKEALSAIEAKARELGFSIGELYATPKKGAAAPRPAKFQNPENAEQTWSGRGRQPQWFKDAIAAGATQDDLLI